MSSPGNPPAPDANHSPPSARCLFARPPYGGCVSHTMEQDPSDTNRGKLLQETFDAAFTLQRALRLRAR